MEPTTAPAIAPPLRPPPPLLPPAAAVEEEVDDAVDEADVDEAVSTRPGIEEKTGSLTSSQILVALDVRQHESVAFVVLARQKSHSPIRLSRNPQKSGSFSSPVMQLPDIDCAGRPQFV